MSGAEIAAFITALIGALGVSVAGIITAVAALRNSNYSAARLKDLETENAVRKAENERLQHEALEARKREEFFRRDIVLIGEQLVGTRADAAKLALLMDQLFRYYKEAVGKDPPIDIQMLEHMRELYYITGELPKMPAETIAQIQRSDDR